MFFANKNLIKSKKCLNDRSNAGSFRKKAPLFCFSACLLIFSDLHSRDNGPAHRGQLLRFEQAGRGLALGDHKNTDLQFKDAQGDALHVKKYECIFDGGFLAHLKSCSIPHSFAEKIMHILKNDDVDSSGQYKVCVLFSHKESRVISFRWKRRDGLQRVYYAYSKKGDGVHFCNKKGVYIKGVAPLVMPLSKVRISSPYGMRMHPIHRSYKHHRGIDLSAPRGTPVSASGSGKVVHVGSLSGYGKCIRIRHRGGYITTYAHLDSYAKNMRKGNHIVVGDAIGRVGMTGTATAPHLHYEVSKGKSLVNPVRCTERAVYLSEKERKALGSQIASAKKYYSI